MRVKPEFRLFLDSDKVQRRVDAKTLRVFYRVGSYGRSVMKNSMKKAPKKAPKTKKLTKSGNLPPPHVRTGLLKNFIFFSVDKAYKVLVIGPTKLNTTKGSFTQHIRPPNSTVPELLDKGGKVDMMLANGRNVEATYAPRPFVQPAFEVALDKFEQLYKTTQL